MFKVQFGLADGVDAGEFDRTPALTIMKHGSVKMELRIIVRPEDERHLDVGGFARDPDSLANIVFEQEVKSKMPVASPCSTCAKFCLSEANPHRTTIHKDAMNDATVIQIKGARIECVEPCTPAIDRDVAEAIYHDLVVERQNYLPVSVIRKIVEHDLNELRNEALFGEMPTMGSMDTFSATRHFAAESYSRESDRYIRPQPMEMNRMFASDPQRPMVLDYLKNAKSKNRNKFIAVAFKQNVTENKGVPKTVVESVW